MTKRMALDRDGKLSWCIAPEDKVGQGKCTHISHIRDGEPKQEFLNRAMREFADYQQNPQSIDYVLRQEDLKNYIKEHENNEDFDEKFKILDIIIDMDLPIKTKGAFCIRTFEALKNNDSSQSRRTEDLDFDYSGDMSYSEISHKICNKLIEEGYDANVVVCHGDEKRIKFNGRKDLKIDITYQDGAEFDNTMLTPKEMLQNKLRLKFILNDRRPKDLIDTQILINLYYPNGISKKELKELIGDDIDIKSFLTKEVIEGNYKQVRKFVPQKIGDYNVNEYVDSFVQMAKGLVNKDINNNKIFKPFAGWNAY